MIREAIVEDAEDLLDLFELLDRETEFLLFEPGERQTTLEQQRRRLEHFRDSSAQVMFVCLDGEADGVNVVGFCVGSSDVLARTQHTVHCVIALAQAHTGKGNGSALMLSLQAWAVERGFHRLELTVVAHNHIAIRLYKSLGFASEGVKRDAVKLDDEFVDELMMAKII